MIPLADCSAAFGRLYGTAPQALACAPGRINLIGEHLDYLGGTVLPMAIARGVTVAASHADSGGLRLQSDFAAGAELHRVHAEALAQRMLQLCGVEHATLCVQSDLPIGRGLSSSAAFCVALARVLLELTGRLASTGTLELAQLAQRCEIEALSVNCGLMDQYASAAGSLIAFDSLSLTHRELTARLEGLRFIVVDSGQPRSLAASGYNTRRAEIEQALSELRAIVGDFNCFRELHIDAALGAARRLDAPAERRLRHIYSEQRRVQQFVSALQSGDAAVMGALLSASHQSLSRDYEVSTEQIDTLAALLQQTRGIHGARIMGGGFGGSVLALTDAELPELALAEALEEYESATGLKGSWLSVEGLGVRNQGLGTRD